MPLGVKVKSLNQTEQMSHSTKSPLPTVSRSSRFQRTTQPPPFCCYFGEYAGVKCDNVNYFDNSVTVSNYLYVLDQEPENRWENLDDETKRQMSLSCRANNKCDNTSPGNELCTFTCTNDCWAPPRPPASPPPAPPLPWFLTPSATWCFNLVHINDDCEGSYTAVTSEQECENFVKYLSEVVPDSVVLESDKEHYF